MALSELKVQLDSVLGELTEHRAKWLAGRTEALRTTPIYGTHAEALSGDLLTALVTDNRMEEARPYLNALTRVQLEGGAAPVSDKFTDALAREIIRDLSEKWLFRETRGKIIEECNRKHRKVFDQSNRRVLARLDVILLERQQAIHTLMVDRGFGGYEAMCKAISGIDYESLIDDLDGLMDDSKAVYRTHLDVALREAGVFPDDARSHDFVYLWGGHFGLARRLPELLSTLTGTFGGMGLEAENMPRLSLDVNPRDGKHPGIHLLAGPETVYLQIDPTQDWDAIPTALGAWGAAVARASTPSDANFAARVLWDGTLETAYRVLFASLAGNREWIERFCPRMDADAQVSRFHLWWLFRLRFLTGSLKYARFLHGPGEMMDKADSYEHYMHEAVGARIERDYYLWDTVDFFDQASTLRGHFLGAQLLDVMIDRFGDDWFSKRDAGVFLGTLWDVGGADVNAVAALAGISEPCSIWPLSERLENVLGAFEGDE